MYKEHLDIVTSYYSALLGVHPVLILASFFFLWLMLQNLHFWKYWLVCASCADHMHGQRAVHTVDEETNVWPWFVGNQNRAWNADKAVGTCEKLGYLTEQDFMIIIKHGRYIRLRNYDAQRNVGFVFPRSWLAGKANSRSHPCNHKGITEISFSE